LTPKEKLKECDTIRHLTREAGVTFIVNDHPDLALLVEADGIHLGQDDLDPVRVRRLVGPEPIIGLSTNSPQQGRAALTQQVDYIGVGPIFPTFTKKDVCPPVGLEYLDYAVENIPLPFVAIGGIKEHNLRQVLQRGAKLVALVTEITGAENIPQKIKTLRKIIQEERDKHEL
jgi:thiamine-phosphate pyrophosphorylase